MDILQSDRFNRAFSSNGAQEYDLWFELELCFYASMSSSSSSAAMTAPQGLRTAKELLQRTARMFYGNRHAILMDQLVRKEA